MLLVVITTISRVMTLLKGTLLIIMTMSLRWGCRSWRKTRIRHSVVVVIVVTRRNCIMWAIILTTITIIVCWCRRLQRMHIYRHQLLGWTSQIIPLCTLILIPIHARNSPLKFLNPQTSSTTHHNTIHITKSRNTCIKCQSINSHHKEKDYTI